MQQKSLKISSILPNWPVLFFVILEPHYQVEIFSFKIKMDSKKYFLKKFLDIGEKEHLIKGTYWSFLIVITQKNGLSNWRWILIWQFLSKRVVNQIKNQESPFLADCSVTIFSNFWKRNLKRLWLFQNTNTLLFVEVYCKLKNTPI